MLIQSRGERRLLSYSDAKITINRFWASHFFENRKFCVLIAQALLQSIVPEFNMNRFLRLCEKGAVC